MKVLNRNILFGCFETVLSGWIKARSTQAGGTGLGLSIVKHVMLLHDGSVEIESVLGEGSTFILYFPINP